jgi:hypothetical protein
VLATNETPLIGKVPCSAPVRWTSSLGPYQSWPSTEPVSSFLTPARAAFAWLAATAIPHGTRLPFPRFFLRQGDSALAVIRTFQGMLIQRYERIADPSRIQL